MIQFLKDYAFLASWIGVVLPLAMAFVQSNRTGKRIDWFAVFIYTTFAVSFSIVISPAFDETARNFSKYFAQASFAVILLAKRSLTLD